MLFCGLVLFAKRSLEPTEIAPYRPLLEAGLIRRLYLVEMPELAHAPVGLSILYLIRQTESQAPSTARELIARVKVEAAGAALREDLIELIETVIFYKLTRLARVEIQAMLQIHDIRESPLYQEAMQEGVEKGIAMVIPKMAAKKMSAAEIAAILDLEVELVQQAMAKTDRN